MYHNTRQKCHGEMARDQSRSSLIERSPRGVQRGQDWDPKGGGGRGEEPGQRTSAFVRLGPTAQCRAQQQEEGRAQAEASMASHHGDSSEVSSTRSRRRRETRRATQPDPNEEARGLLEQVRNEFRTWKREHGSRPYEVASPLLRTPFTQEVMNQPYPHDLRVPGSKDYDGRTDPELHINSYYGNMLMMGVTDAVMCRAFYSTLSSRAAEWFKALEPGSISCFADLATKFVRKFVTSKTVRKHFMYLEKAKQLEGESLSDFLVKWKTAIGEVEPMDDLTAINMLHCSLRAGALYQDFILHPPTTYEDAIRRVTDYANAGEANAAKRSQETGTSQKPPGRPEGRQGEPQGKGRGKMTGFTPLNRPAADVLRYAQSCNMIALPEPFRDGRDKDKYCAYHRCKGHETEECSYLRQLIEDLLQSGKLEQFTAKKEGGKKSSWKKVFKRSDQGKKDKGPDEPPHSASKQVIHVIFGGLEDGARQVERHPMYLVESGDSTKRQKLEPITFTPEDIPAGSDQSTEALVVTVDIMGTDVQRVMIDTGSSVNVLYLEVFQKLKLDPMELTPVGTTLSGFTGDTIHPEGKIRLPVELGIPPRAVKVIMEFVVVNLRCVHNAILGRPAIAMVGGIISMPHLCMKFPTPEGVGVLRGDVRSARKCYLQAVNRKEAGSSRVNTISKQNGEGRKEQPEPSDEVEEWPLHDSRPDRRIKIGKFLSPELKESVLSILREFSDIFAWGPEDMPGIDRSVICHHLAVNPGAKPIKQKTRHLSSDRREFVRGEVKALAVIGHIRPVVYPDWVANVVLVPKPPAWRMCIDYTDLNRACPLDPYPLPSIHQMVDETAGADLMSFMDASKGYHQIMMAEEDESKTSFVTPDGLYCYKVMPFGLRNAGATYQRMINRLFEPLLGSTMEAYVDDMLVKSRDRLHHAQHLRECFQIMRKYRLRLNPNKCTFAVETGKFLGFMMTKRGIEPNPSKVKAILDMQAPTTIREVQQLTGRLAALSRFLSKLAERALPFFKTLRKVSGFNWDDECRAAFDELKEYLMSPIVLSKPEPGEDLDVYLAVSDRAVSAVLCRTDREGVQRPVYYVSHALQGPELRYSRLEKVVYALYIAAKKLTPYFQGRTVRVLTDQPISAILRTTTSSGRLVKWAMMLTQFAIEYKPRPAIKGQALADFVVECTARDPRATEQVDTDASWWEVATDGSSSRRGSGGGVVITSPEGFKVYYALIYQFSPTNNEAEYEAFIAGLQHAKDLGADYIRVQTDSSLVVGQVLGDYEVNGERLYQYRNLALERLTGFKAYAVKHVPRLDNADADILSKLVQDAPEHVSRIARVLVLLAPSIDRLEVTPVNTEENWISDIMTYLQEDRLPEDLERARKAKLRAPRFQVVDDRLYRRSYGGPLMRCLTDFEASIVMTELHSGLCSSHQGGRSLARRIMVIGYYWPSIQLDCEKIAKECEACQLFAKMPGRPATFYQPVSTAVPFARWGVDIIGPFPQLSGRRRFIIVAIDYFSKWIEAEPLATITSQQCARFLWRNVVSRFGVPVQLITDNGKQFEGQYFQNFLATIGTRSLRSSVAYPQGNGQVENANRTILEGLKKKLYMSGRSWADELPFILWTYRTTPREATRETPFALVYGAEARLPIEAWIPTAREKDYDPEENESSLAIDLDCLEEKREATARRVAEYQKKIKASRDVQARPRYFQVGDYVLRRREASQPQEGGKLAQNWEGPYVISAVVRPGTYRLETTTGRPIERTWNSDNLVLFRH